MIEKYRKFLLSLPLIKPIQEEGLKEISSIASFLKLKKEEILFKEGSEGEDLYIILEGKAEVLKKGKDNKEYKLTELEKGAVIGEIAFLCKTRRTATLKAKEELLLFIVDGKKLEEKIKKGEPNFVLFLLNLSQIIATRLNKMNSEFLNLIEKGECEKEDISSLKEKLKEGWIF